MIPLDLEQALLRRANLTIPIPPTYTELSAENQRLSEKLAFAIAHRRACIPESMKRIIIKRDKNHCRYCDKRLTRHSRVFDHVTPWILVREHRVENIVLACRDCNSRKGAKLLVDVGMVLQEVAA